MTREFSYPAQIQSLPQIQMDLKELGKEWELPFSETRQLTLMTEELFSRIVRFIMEENEDQFIQIRITREKEYLLKEISYPGRSFNPMEVAEKSVSDPLAVEEDGMGQALIRAMTETVVYERREGRNILMLKKLIRGALDGT